MNLTRIASACLFLLLAVPGFGIGAQEGEQPDPLTGLYRYANSIYVEAEWNDGDSFQVRLPTGRQITARLYQVDSIEISIHDTTAARRLRAQRRYFGISDFGSSPRDSIEKAIELGEVASQFTRKALSQPFTLWTSFADARGGGGDRIYVFIETADGQSLADQLVKAGLARAFGVYRQTHRGVSQSESIDRMRDLELSAAAGRRGIWAYTDWEALPNERSLERAEIEELRAAMRLGPQVSAENPIAIDQADASALQQLPGIGPALAQRIIEQREQQAFRRKADLLKVPGIGIKTFDTLEPLITLSVEDEED